MNNLAKLEKLLGIKFKNLNILHTALNHSSFANENKCQSNETMEFLGDSVLSLCMSTHLYKTSDKSEGEMTKIRASLVCEEALFLYASKLQLATYLNLGNGEEASGGRTRQAIIADAFEAILGAVYLDSNFETVYKVFDKIVIPYIDLIEVLDYKSKLQELVQADKRSIAYNIVNESGPSHDKTFEAVVKLENNIVLGKGQGKTKKEAEQKAAEEALSKIAK